MPRPSAPSLKYTARPSQGRILRVLSAPQRAAAAKWLPSESALASGESPSTKIRSPGRAGIHDESASIAWFVANCHWSFWSALESAVK